MALIKCPECGKEISDQSSACVNCGYPLGELQAHSNPLFEREERFIQTNFANTARSESQTTVHVENLSGINNNNPTLDFAAVSPSPRKTWIVILLLVALATIAIISVVCYNNYQEPERDGMRFRKIDRVNEYCLEEYVGSDSIVVIPDEIYGIPVTAISEEAFYNCENLRAVEIPQSVKYIGQKAFAGCSGLTTIEIPSSIVKIYAWAFEGCSGLEKITFLDSWGEVGKDRALEEIEQGAFSNCTSLKNVTIPAQLKILGKYAFSDCTNLATVNFENNSQLKRIEQGAFSDCSALKNLSIPLSVEYIGANAFSRCEKIEAIEITPIEGWVVFHDEPWVVSGAPSKVPVGVLQDPAQTAYYLVGDFSKYAWERRE